MSILSRAGGIALLTLTAAACADRDNPTALADLQADVQLEITTPRVETFTQVEFHTTVSQSGVAMPMQSMQLTMESHDGAVTIIGMEPDGDGYSAHVVFYEAGEHHVIVEGAPRGHHAGLMTRMMSQEIEVHNQHQIVGPYWVEMEVSPAPVPEGGDAQIHLHVHEFDGVNPGEEVSGVAMHAELHHPDGDEVDVSFEEEAPGEYEASVHFPEAGMYEVHLEVEVDEVHYEGEFHIPVLSDTVVVDPTEPSGGGHGHGS